MENEILESNKKLVEYLIQDIIRFSLTIYGVEHTVDVESYMSLPVEQLIALHKQLRKDYLQALGVQVEEQETSIKK